MRKKRTFTWDSIYLRNLAKGYDHGYAAHRADMWAAAQEKKQKKLTDCRAKLAAKE